MKRILFITSNRVGDAVLTTGILSWLLEQHPDARLTVACGPLTVEIFQNIPQLERVIPMRKGKRAAHWRALWSQCVGHRWHMVVDLRHSLFSWLVATRNRRIFRPDEGAVHKLDQLARTVRAPHCPLPRLWISDEQHKEAARLLPEGGPILGIGPTANWASKQWPADRFIAFINRLTAVDGLLPQARVAVFGGPGEEQAAAEVLAAIPADRRIDLVGKTGIGIAAACLSRCALYVGNDSGLMHLSSAAGSPTIGLFGPSREDWYAPRGPRSTYVRSPLTHGDMVRLGVFAERTPTGLMDGIEVDKVVAAAEKLLES